jgi:hypothetical protein
VLWSVLIFYCASRSHRNSNLNWIQISLQIIIRIEKENDFSNSYSVMGRNLAHPGASPAHPPFTFSHVCPSSRPGGPASAQRHWFEQLPNRVYNELITERDSPLHDFCPTNAESSSVRDRIARTFSQLRFDARSPINSSPCSSNFIPQAPNPSARGKLLCELDSPSSKAIESRRSLRGSRWSFRATP